jgi:RNA polymerase sigma-70 factor (ECF subfamily)
MNLKDFEILYSSFAPKLERYLNSYFSVEDSQDLMQDIFIKIHNSLPQFRGDSNINTWMYRIATNSVIDKLKSSSHKMAKSKQDLSCTTHHFNNAHFANTFDRQIEKKEMSTCIRNFILQLTEKNKTVFVLSSYEDLSNQEIAEILNISIDSVKIRLHRAKETLKSSLAKNCNIYVDEYGDMACEPTF